MSGRPQVICLTPVRNEAPNLARFLAAAETWADAIVVADQGSTDGSRDLAARHPKVLLVDNPSKNHDQGRQQRLVLEAARAAFPKPRVLIALDADEALTSNATSRRGWQTMLSAPPGTPVLLRWLNLLPGAKLAWVPHKPIRFGFVDDGCAYEAGVMHTPRLPAGSRRPLVLDDLAVLHLQYLNWPQMKAKQRFYQAWERIHFPRKRPTQIYRQYHGMDALSPAEIVRSNEEWFAGYRAVGIDLTTFDPTGRSWWDKAVLELIAAHGAETFRRLDVWEHDWAAVAPALGEPVPKDPRSTFDRWVFRLLAATQRESHRYPVRLVQRALALVGW